MIFWVVLISQIVGLMLGYMLGQRIGMIRGMMFATASFVVAGVKAGKIDIVKEILSTEVSQRQVDAAYEVVKKAFLEKADSPDEFVEQVIDDADRSE